MHLSSIQTAKVLLNFENQEAKSGTKLDFFETKALICLLKFSQGVTREL